MYRRFLDIVLAFVMCASLVPAQALAQQPGDLSAGQSVDFTEELAAGDPSSLDNDADLPEDALSEQGASYLAAQGYKVTQVEAMGGMCCGAITDDGSLWMWGINTYGQLGDGTTDKHDEPVWIMSGAKKLFFDQQNTDAVFPIVLKSDGSVWSWGGDYGGYMNAQLYVKPPLT